MRVKKVVVPAFAMASVGIGLLMGCHGEMHLGDTTPVNSVASAPPPPPPPPPPATTPPPAATTPPPPPKAFKLRGVAMKGNQIDIPGDIQFQVNSATINEKDTGTQAVLQAVLKVMQDNPTLTTLRVEGHTDSDGGNGLNKPLSQKRADAVAAWLVKNGIDQGRLHSVGFGQDCPMAPNTTAANKAINRRTEFRVEAMNGTPSPDDAKDANGCSTHTAAAAAAGGTAPAASSAATATGGAAPAAATKH